MDEQRKLSRRGFVGAAAGATAATAWQAPVAIGHGRDGGSGRRHRGRLLPRDRIGIQLFTVRDQVATLGFEAVFARLSEIGYARSSSQATPPRDGGGATRSCGSCCGATGCAASAAT